MGMLQSGGVGDLLGMSLGDMLEEDAPPSVYSNLLRPMTGSELMGCFTTKNFSFLNAKKAQFKESLLKAVGIVGSREELVIKYATDLRKLLVPNEVERKEEVEKKVDRILRQHISSAVGIMTEPPEEDITDRVMGHIRLMYCESLMAISQHCPNIGTPIPTQTSSSRT